MKTREMTPKQKAFVQEYLIDLNATQSAIRAGYSAKKASEIGYELLHKTAVMTAIAEAQDKRSEKTNLTAESVLKNIVRLATKAEESGRFADALRGQELLGRHLAMFTDRVETPGAPDSISIVFRRNKADAV
jgi:phage terminase small subunit